MEQIAINILPKGAKPICHSSQFDEGRQIMFNLFNDATPYTLSGTETISVLVRKPDGAEVLDSVTNTSDSYVVWDVSTDACELSGVCECELSIVENGILLGSRNFTMKVEEDVYNGKTIEVRTASGRIATFNTNMVEAFKSLKSEINPVQDLHGYSKPWIGGGGKNKLQITATTQTINGITFAIDNEGVITTSGTFSENTNIAVTTNFFLKAGTYILNGCPSGGSYSRYVVRIENGSAQRLALDMGNGEQFTLAEDTYVWCRIYLYSQDGIGKTFKPMVRLATESDSSFAPYSNICPISGFSALNVTRTGVNLCYQVISGASISGGGQIVSEPSYAMGCALLKKGVTYTVTTQEGQLVGGYFSSSPTIGSTAYDNTRFVLSNKTITPTQDCYIAFRMPSNYTTQPQVNIGSTALPYVAYNGQTATVNFGQTVYGGVADVTNGKLKITHEYCVFNGTETITSNTQGGHTRFSCQKLVNLADNSASNENFCSHFIASSSPIGQNQTDNAIGVYNRGLYWRTDQFTDVTAMKNYLLAQYNANTPVMYVAKLATPIEITTTPENLTAIVGQQNNVYGDTNGDTEVEYYIEV